MGLRKRSGSVPTTLPKTTFSSRSMCVYWLYLSCLLSLMYIPARFSSQFGQVRPSCKVWLIFATKSKNRPFNYIKTLHSFNDPPLVLVMQARPLRGHLKEIWGALDSGYYPPLQTLWHHFQMVYMKIQIWRLDNVEAYLCTVINVIKDLIKVRTKGVESSPLPG